MNDQNHRQAVATPQQPTKEMRTILIVEHLLIQRIDHFVDAMLHHHAPHTVLQNKINHGKDIGKKKIVVAINRLIVAETKRIPLSADAGAFSSNDDVGSRKRK